MNITCRKCECCRFAIPDDSSIEFICKSALSSGFTFFKVESIASGVWICDGCQEKMNLKELIALLKMYEPHWSESHYIHASLGFFGGANHEERVQ